MAKTNSKAVIGATNNAPAATVEQAAKRTVG